MTSAHPAACMRYAEADHVAVSLQIAFSSISLALQYYVEDMQQGQYRVHHGVVSKQPGSGPNEMGSFQLQDHFAVKTDVPVLSKL